MNVSDLNSLIKKYKLIERIKRQNPIISCIQEMYVADKDKKLKVEGQKIVL
jgi:hypothetical protein